MDKPVKTSIISGGEEISTTYYRHLSSNKIVFILTGDSPKGTKSSSWPPLIKSLLENDMSVVTFDFLSQGDSKGERKNLSLSVGIQNFYDVTQHYFSQIINVKSSEIYAIGSSFGASVLLNSESVLNYFAKLVFKSPALDLALAYENDEGGIEKIKEWRNRGVSETSGLSFGAYLDAIAHNPFANIELLSKPILIIQGEKDEIVSLELSKRLAFLTYPFSSIALLRGVKHNYKQRNGMSLFIQQTVDFLKGSEK